jgi:hypothetical protein
LEYFLVSRWIDLTRCRNALLRRADPAPFTLESRGLRRHKQDEPKTTKPSTPSIALSQFAYGKSARLFAKNSSFDGWGVPTPE